MPPPSLPRGPRKKKSKGSRIRLTNHKRRAGWFQARASWPVREAPVRRLLSERTRAERRLRPAPGTTRWECVGPSNIGGRATSIVCHPANPDLIWLGTAGGGVWHSADAGSNWRALWHRQRVLNVGALAIDPTRPDVLYCGTGEANLSADSYAGVGLYQSTNGGRSWRLLASSARTGLPRRIGVIAIDPFDPQHLVIGGVGYDDDEKGGMYVSRNGGRSWRRETFISTRNHWCHAVVFHPAKAGVIYATVTENGARNGIWRTMDGGRTWTQLRQGLPAPGAMGRTSLALSPSNPDVLYALASDASDQVLGVFRSADGGGSWNNVAGRHFRDEAQLFYGNTITVHPADPDHVLCGGVDLHLTRNGGRTWAQATDSWSQAGKATYAHADHHALLMPAARPGLVYDVNDGGLDVSADGGRTWVNRSNGLAATMFYDVDVAQTDAKVFAGGAQDNGTLLTETGQPGGFREILGGDGGWIVFDPANARHLYASCQNLEIHRWRPGGRPRDVSPPVSDAERAKVWMTYITLDPNDARTVFCGSTRVWRTKDDGETWTAVSKTLDGSPITAIEVAPAESRVVYVGTENGAFFRSTDAGSTWSANLSGAEMPGRTITRIESHPTKAQVLLVTLANFGHPHLFRSEDGGLTWIDTDRGQLPDVPHSAVLIRPDAPRTIYVAGDAGVFMSRDFGETWMSLRRNLPNVMCVDLVYQEAEQALFTATYGRSIWRLKV